MQQWQHGGGGVSQRPWRCRRCAVAGVHHCGGCCAKPWAAAHSEAAAPRLLLLLLLRLLLHADEAQW